MMQSARRLAAALSLGLAALAAAGPAPAAPATAAPPALRSTMSHGMFDDAPIFRPAGRMTGFALLLSGANGWDDASRGLAQAMAAQGTMVVGIDTARMMAKIAAQQDACTFPDGDMENLSRFIQAYEKVPGYYPPILVGQGQGASLAYALHAQGAAARFAGLVTVDFCPTLPMPKPLCHGQDQYFRWRGDGKGVELLTSRAPAHPWIALQTPAGPAACPAAQAFLTRTPGVQARQADSQAALQRELVSAAAALDAQRPPQLPPGAADVAGLPIVEVPAQDTGKYADTFAILLSGDGGWADLDKDVADSLARQGVPTVGVDSLRYFWTARTPESVTADVERMIRYYTGHWKRGRVLLIGYSQGADALPFVLNRLSPAALDHVAVTALMGLGKTAAFQFSVANWITSPSKGLPIPPEADRMPAGRAICIYGEEETDSSCPGLNPGRTRGIRLPGGHHFDRDYDKLARLILEAARPPAH